MDATTTGNRITITIMRIVIVAISECCNEAAKYHIHLPSLQRLLRPAYTCATGVTQGHSLVKKLAKTYCIGFLRCCSADFAYTRFVWSFILSLGLLGIVEGLSFAATVCYHHHHHHHHHHRYFSVA